MSCRSSPTIPNHTKLTIMRSFEYLIFYCKSWVDSTKTCQIIFLPLNLQCFQLFDQSRLNFIFPECFSTSKTFWISWLLISADLKKNSTISSWNPVWSHSPSLTMMSMMMTVRGLRVWDIPCGRWRGPERGARPLVPPGRGGGGRGTAGSGRDSTGLQTYH